MALKKIEIIICDDCLNGVGFECHTPGCALFMHRVDLPIDKRLYKVIDITPCPPKVVCRKESVCNVAGYGGGCNEKHISASVKRTDTTRQITGNYVQRKDCLS